MSFVCIKLKKCGHSDGILMFTITFIGATHMWIHMCASVACQKNHLTINDCVEVVSGCEVRNKKLMITACYMWWCTSVPRLSSYSLQEYVEGSLCSI